MAARNPQKTSNYQRFNSCSWSQEPSKCHLLEVGIWCWVELLFHMPAFLIRLPGGTCWLYLGFRFPANRNPRKQRWGLRSLDACLPWGRPPITASGFSLGQPLRTWLSGEWIGQRSIWLSASENQRKDSNHKTKWIITKTPKVWGSTRMLAATHRPAAQPDLSLLLTHGPWLLRVPYYNSQPVPPTAETDFTVEQVRGCSQSRR